MKKFFWVICMFPLLQACTTVQIISFDRLHPADVNFPSQIRNVGIVNSMPVVEVDDGEQKRSSGLLEGDGRVATESLAQEIAATGYFDKVVICDSAVWKNPVPMENFLPEAMVDSLAYVLGVDMLLVMERVHIQLSDGLMMIPELMGAVPAIDGVVTPLLRSYVPGRDVPIFAVSKSDTLCWEKSPSLTFAQIVKEASEYGGSMPVQTLLPYWVETQRYYFDGGSVEMRDAGVYVRESNWADAIELWKQVYDAKKGKARMRAAFNLALSCEMQDDYVRAKEYLDEASLWVGEDSQEGALIGFYRRQLEEQMQKSQRLRMQMQRFE